MSNPKFNEFVQVHIQFFPAGSTVTIEELDWGHPLSGAWEECVPGDYEYKSETEVTLDTEFVSVNFDFLHDGLGQGFLEYEYDSMSTDALNDGDSFKDLLSAVKEQRDKALAVSDDRPWWSKVAPLEMDFLTLWEMELVHARSGPSYWGDDDDEDVYRVQFIRVVPVQDLLKAVVAQEVK